MVGKLLFSTVTPEDVPYLKGSPRWTANRHVEKNDKFFCKRTPQPVHLVQVDVAVVDERSPTNWVYGTFASKTAILAAFSRRLDAEILAALDADATEAPVRERLFDVLMKRFDALNPHRQAIANILRDSCADPLAAICGLAPLCQSMAWMLEGAGIGSQGPLGLVRIKGLSMIYLSALAVWLRDDSPDMAKTMAHLDKRLRQAENCVIALRRRRRRSAAPAGAEAG